jgi:phosphoadenosine phosphosulfate reductase
MKQTTDYSQTETIPPVEWQESTSPQEILRWALTTYGEKLTMATAFGAEGCALLDMLARLRDETGITPDIFNLETGYQFPQTLALCEKIEKRYGFSIRRIRPDEGIIGAEAKSKEEFNKPLYKTDPNLCCYFRKVAPLGPAIENFDAWITAIRRDQTPERANAAIIGPDDKFDLVKINPLANWTKEQVWNYIDENNVPTNPLHTQGFPSIGCWPCTRPVAAGQDDRAGRWAGTEKKECGLHIEVSSSTLKRASSL